ncbi:hypothetical protein N657DRAFT_509088 [Parathielavia appendiculata]|uniref:Uncharacterized protein n=1 Tax=Parathielavia appendiculata TaxID=2587402 RepID=A0AAN6TZ82_9PEZI|nr:hypothetical protein N657DRAFT_509088 [Parathielavia appendiculata]
MVKSRDDILAWIATAADNLMLTGQEARAILVALYQARVDGRNMALEDIIRTYTSKTRRPNEGDLFPIYHRMVRMNQEKERCHLGSPNRCSMPLALLLQFPTMGVSISPFRSSFFHSGSAHNALEHYPLKRSHNKVSERRGLSNNRLGLAQSLWAPMGGCVHRRQAQLPPHTPYPAFETPRQRWEDGGFTVGLRHLIEADIHGASRCGKPWKKTGVWLLAFLSEPRSLPV